MAALASLDNGSVGTGKDGLHVTAALAMAPTLPIAFHVSRVPTALGPLVPATQESTTTYRVQAGNLDLLGTAIPAWVTAIDTAGASAQLPVWCRYGTDLDLGNELAETLRTILMDNLPLIDLRLARYAPNGRNLGIDQVLVGMSEIAENDQPFIDIQTVNDSEEFFYMPNGKAISADVNIMCAVYHMREVPWRSLVVAVGHSVRDILNQQAYTGSGQADGIILPSSLQLTRAHVSNARFSEFWDGAKFVANMELTWTAELAWAMP